MDLGLWSTLWANCALGTTILALPTIPIITPQVDTNIQQQHDHETQTASDSDESDAGDDSDKEEADGIEDASINDARNCFTSDSNSVESSVENGETAMCEVAETRNEKQKKAYQRVRYSREEYRCTICPYTCTTERAFLRHLRAHSSNEGPESNVLQTDSIPRLSCPVCGKDRNGETLLNKHMMKHRENRHFCCDLCAFKTVQLKKLIQHRRMHTGERPHLCPHCAYRSARRDNLRSHVRRVHKRDNLTCDTFSPRGMLLIPSSKHKSTSDSSIIAED